MYFCIDICFEMRVNRFYNVRASTMMTIYVDNQFVFIQEINYFMGVFIR